VWIEFVCGVRLSIYLYFWSGLHSVDLYLMTYPYLAFREVLIGKISVQWKDCSL
jgi:hypothetical protein